MMGCGMMIHLGGRASPAGRCMVGTGGTGLGASTHLMTTSERLPVF